MFRATQVYVCSMHFKARSFVYLFIYLQVVGAYFENTGSKSFAVYAIAVTDAENKTWFVKRRQVHISYITCEFIWF